MIKTVFQDFFMIIIVGGLFARMGRQSIINAPTLFMSKAFRYAFIFQLAVWTPIGLYLLIAYPAWSWWYYVPDERFTFYHIVGPVFIEFLLMIAGFTIAGELVKQGKSGFANTFIAGIVIIYLGLVFYPFDTWYRVGTYAEFHSGTAKTILELPRMKLELGVMGLYFFLPLVYIFSRLSKVE